MDPAGLPALIEAIKHLHGCKAVFVESVPVHDTFDGKTAWIGEVQVFDLKGHPTATRCYAWSYALEGTRRRFLAVLHEGPVNSPVNAVRASVVADVKASKRR